MRNKPKLKERIISLPTRGRSYWDTQKWGFKSPPPNILRARGTVNIYYERKGVQRTFVRYLNATR